MRHIGVISDTHGYLDARVFEHFKDCDEIWHAGDFGTMEVSDQLAEFKPLKGVYGNIDNHEIRKVHPLEQEFTVESVKVFMIHIGGKPGRYDASIVERLNNGTPDIFVCGHSHLLRVEKDKRFSNMLYLNPGAAGITGQHETRTIVRFHIDEGQMGGMEVIELQPR